MKIFIKETGEIKDLSIVDNNGIEWTYDLTTATDFWNADEERYEMSLDDYNWWNEYITNYENDEQEAQDLADELEIDIDIINDRINSYGINDMGDEHMIKQIVFEEIRNEYK